MEILIFVFAGLAALGVAYFVWQQGVKRREALMSLAVSRGLDYSRHDMYGIASRHPFKFWNKGDERKWHNVMTGSIDGRPVVLFDFDYTEITRDSEGRQQRTTHKFTAAIATLDGAFTPGLQLSAENLMTRLKDKAGFRDLELESEEFNRRFEVQARDRKFAVAFLDARMMNWLMTTPKDLQFEVLGGHVLVLGSRVAPDQWMLRHHVATEFASRTPDVVRSLFPGD